MNLIQQFADPAAIHSLSLMEKLTGSAITAVMGMGVTFLVLILMWASISILGKVINIMEAKAARKPAGLSSARGARKNTDPGRAAQAPPQAGPAPCPNQSDRDRELAAVITAAAAAYAESAASRKEASFQGGGLVKRFYIRRIKRAAGDSWSQAGKLENMR